MSIPSSRMRAYEKVFVTQAQGIRHSHTWGETMLTHPRALVLWNKEGGVSQKVGAERSGWMYTDTDTWWALGGHSWPWPWSKGIVGKRKERGTSPLWVQIRIPFSRLSISIWVWFFLHFQDYRGLSADYWPVDNSHNYYCCLLSNYYVLATVVNSFPV